jgi:hypothetical protein
LLDHHSSCPLLQISRFKARPPNLALRSNRFLSSFLIATFPLIPSLLSFAQFGFDAKLLKKIQKYFENPTPIQAQGGFSFSFLLLSVLIAFLSFFAAVPVAMKGCDIIGIAKTGSGKTAAFVWPMITHVMDQREIQYAIR